MTLCAIVCYSKTAYYLTDTIILFFNSMQFFFNSMQLVSMLLHFAHSFAFRLT